MMIMNLTTTICISAASLIFFENICWNFEAKMLSTFSTTSTILKTNKIIDKITLIQNTTFFYKKPILIDFSTSIYNFYTLIAKSDLQNAENVDCRKLSACRKCRMY